MRLSARWLRPLSALLAVLVLAAACGTRDPGPSLPGVAPLDRATPATPPTPVLPAAKGRRSAPLGVLAARATQSSGEGGEPVGERPAGEDDGDGDGEFRMPVRGTPGRPARIQGPRVSLPAGVAAPMPSPAVSFDGIGQGFGGYTPVYWPPDTSIAVGSTQVMELVNADVAVFDKAGALLAGPMEAGALFSGYDPSSLCSSTNDGDPVVTWDRAAHRWVMTWFAITGADGTTVPYEECVAVSVTDDALGDWYLYSFEYASLNDYPKLAVWGDSYVVTFNMFNPDPLAPGGYAWVGGEVCAYDRSSMLAGDAARPQQCFNAGAWYGGLLAADTDSRTAAPSWAPVPILAIDTTSTLAAFGLNVDWDVPANSSLSDPQVIGVDAFNLPCGDAGSCIPQPGTTRLLDSLGDRLMNRLAYRNDAGVETLTVTHSIDNGSLDGTRLRWYELSIAGDRTVVLEDQGTYAPDATSRWMGSAAHDRVGNLAIGYSRGSGSVYPGLAWAGRLAGDPVATLTQTETMIVAGGGSQTARSRWGDYSAMVVDPADECTFWFGGEYEPSPSGSAWRTRIASFAFQSCLDAPVSASVVAPATPTSAATLTFSLVFSGPVTNLTADDLVPEGTGAAGCVVGTPVEGADTWTVDVTGCSEGGVALRLIADSVTTAGSGSAPATDVVSDSVLVDRTAPGLAAAPKLVLGTGSALATASSASRVPVVLSWSGSDPGLEPSGVAAWKVESSPDGIAWTTLAPATVSPYRTTVPVSGSTRLRVTGLDAAGNWSAPLASVALSPRLVQQSAFTYLKTWSTATSSTLSAGSARYAGAYGASATYRLTGRGFSLVVTRAANRGKLRLYIDGVAVTLDTYRATTMVRSLLYTKTWASYGTHTIKVVVLGTAGRPRVDIDAVVVLK